MGPGPGAPGRRSASVRRGCTHNGPAGRAVLGSQTGPCPQRLPHHRADPGHPSLVLFGAPLLSLLQHCGSSWAQKFLRKHHLPLAPAFPLKRSCEHSSGTRLGAVISEPRATQKNVAGLGPAVSSAGLGLFFRFRPMECFCFLQKRNPGRWVSSYWETWGILANGPRCSGRVPPLTPRTWSPCPPGGGAGPFQEGMLHLGKPSSHSRAPLWRWGVGAEGGVGVSG